MKLSKNFTLGELTKSQTATRHGIDNTPSLTTIDNLQVLVDNVLQPIREHFNRPVTISSGYRSPAINKIIGGSDTSHHSRGMAADFEIMGMDNKELATWIRDNLKYTQLILEFYEDGDANSGWVHVGYDPTDLKCQVLRARRVNGKTVYSTGI
jgi:zinc D-Ala-D-Ala carboxypeptidase